MIYEMKDLIGHTPVVNFDGLFVKLEGYNLGGSIKDRVAFKMLMEHQTLGEIKPGDTIVTATSGNTGIGLCLASGVMGYKAVIVMPDNMSVERIKIMRAYGGEVILTPADSGMNGANAKASELAANKGYFLLDQFSDPFNPLAHEQTAKEIMDDFSTLDYLVCGIGSGGTITGLARVLKKRWPSLCVVGIEPAESAVITGGQAGRHGIQGIGAGFIPQNLDLSLVDEIQTVKSSIANDLVMDFGNKGLFLGISSCAAIYVGQAILMKNPDKKVLVISPDFGEKYLSVVK